MSVKLQESNKEIICWNPNVDQQTVKRAVDQLIQSLAIPYLALVKRTKEEILQGRIKDLSGSLTFAAYPLDNGFIDIPNYLVKSSLQSGERRFYAKIVYSVRSLHDQIPIENLLLKLSQRITDLGYFAEEVELRLEKGCFESSVQWWHRDGSIFSTAIATNYGTKKCWSTRVVADSALDAARIKWDPEWNPDYMVREINLISEPAKFNYLYDVKKILHRSPIEEDLMGETIGVDDYRLFIRFNSRREVVRSRL